MLGFATALVMASNLAGGVSQCAEEPDTGHHLADVCAPYIDGAPAVSATWYGSLNPKPAHQQVMIFRYEGEWRMRIAGYRWTRGSGVVEHRRNEITISDDDANAIIDLMDASMIERLAAQPYYGSDDVICTDGARYLLDRAHENQRHQAARHSCAGRTEINDIFGKFREIALRYDPSFDGLLTGLS